MSVVLAILKWIGILAGGILGLVIVLAVLVLCVPVRYRLSGSNEGALRYQYRVSWLFPLIAVVKKEDSDVVGLHILGIPIMRLSGGRQGKEKEKDKGRKRARKSSGAKEPSEEIEGTADREQRTAGQEGQLAGQEGRTADREQWAEGQSGQKEPGTVGARGKGKRAGRKKVLPKWLRGRKTKKNRNRQKKSFSFDKLSSIIKFVGDTENRRIFQKAKRELWLLARYLAPRKIRGRFVIGMGNPASTGMLFGGISLLPFVYQDGVDISPDFDGKVFRMDGMMKGRIRALYLVRLVIRIYRDRDLRKLWDYFMVKL